MFSCYDLARCPASYDVVAYLCALEAERINRGEDFAAVYIQPGPNEGFRKDNFWPKDIPTRQLMLNNVVLPMIKMLPSVKYVEVLRKRSEYKGAFGSPYGLRVQIDAMKRGIRPLRAKNIIPKQKNLVTITLRESQHWPERNSNLPEWLRVANQLADWDYQVILIPDTFSDNHGFFGKFSQFSSASKDLDIRATLYSAAFCNMFVSNGPAWFALALDAPVLMMKPVTENLMSTCSSEYFELCGIPKGGQIPSSPAYQRLAWGADNAYNILSAFEEFVDLAG